MSLAIKLMTLEYVLSIEEMVSQFTTKSVMTIIQTMEMDEAVLAILSEDIREIIHIDMKLSTQLVVSQMYLRIMLLLSHSVSQFCLLITVIWNQT